ncbi:MAG TPA: carboxypeptidase-like regulatory domain-containing protein [Polyangiaceae bacterium]|nr:carboxypeptidase-like regulatory domain-containing protein [Polyangiaceae bacterium]
MEPVGQRSPWVQLRELAGTLVGSLAAGTLMLSAAGCRCSESDPGPTPAASVPASVASGLPIAPEVISRAVNPRSEKAYAGPVGTVRGRIRATGDPAPTQEQVLSQVPSECATAREVYGPLFREGPERGLADVLVAITGYEGYVPARAPIEVVEASGCAWSSRTVALTFGQRLDVVSKDRRAYVPQLMGSNMGAQIIALPGGAESTMYPQSPGRYVLVDSMRIFSTAEVLVLKYATHDVTGVDGKYEISGVPVGALTLNALLPATGATLQREVVVEAGKTVELDLELPFNAAEYKARPSGSAAAPSSSAAPPPAASASPPR